jgi:hypothetical protein
MGFFFTSTGAAVLAGLCALIAALIGIFQV